VRECSSSASSAAEMRGADSYAASFLSASRRWLLPPPFFHDSLRQPPADFRRFSFSPRFRHQLTPLRHFRHRIFHFRHFSSHYRCIARVSRHTLSFFADATIDIFLLSATCRFRHCRHYFHFSVRDADTPMPLSRQPPMPPRHCRCSVFIFFDTLSSAISPPPYASIATPPRCAFLSSAALPLITPFFACHALAFFPLAP
jgi:hypothetical protein